MKQATAARGIVDRIPAARRAARLRRAGLGIALVLLGPAMSCELERPAPAVADADVRIYQIRDRMTMRVRRRSGDEAFRFGVDAVAAFQPLGADSARGWIDEASGFMASGNRRLDSDPRFVIRRPFVLVRDADGHFRSVERPAVPDDLPGTQEFMRSLVETFENFDPPLPETGLEPGVTWSDTFAFERAGGSGARAYTQATAYRVLRDTVVAGRRALVVDVSGQTVRDDAPGQDWLRGTATWVVFADGTTAGVRSRSEGVLSGEVVERLGMGADSVEVEATGTVELISPSAGGS